MAARVYLPEDRTPTAIDRLLASPAVLLGAAFVLLVVVPVALVWALWVFAGDAVRAFLSNDFYFRLLVMVVLLLIIVHLCAGCILAERKISAFMQDRHGPNRVGYWGLLQPIADGIKFLLKEEIIPAHVDKPIYLLAPALAFTVALIAFAVIPWAGEITWPWTIDGLHPTVSTQVAPLDIGILYILAVGSMSVYGVVLGGWASNNKYSFYGGMRAAAQMISYEIPLGLIILIVLLLHGTLRPEVIVAEQAQSGVWNILLQPLAFVLMFTCALAETNRAPFDLAECEQELVGGFHTEYSSMKFALFFLGEYAHMITASALMALLFFGGWAILPFTHLLADNHTWWAALIKFAVFWAKIGVFIALYMIIRWTLPRFRFDQLMRIAWTGMIPIGLLLLIGTGILAAFGLERNIFASLVMNAVALAIILAVLSRSRAPVTGRQPDLPPVEVVSTP